MSQKLIAEFDRSPALGRTPNIIRLPLIVPGVWNPDENKYVLSPARALDLLSEVRTETWSGSEEIMLFTELTIAVDYRKHRILLTYNPTDESLQQISRLDRY